MHHDTEILLCDSLERIVHLLIEISQKLDRPPYSNGIPQCNPNLGQSLQPCSICGSVYVWSCGNAGCPHINYTFGPITSSTGGME